MNRLSEFLTALKTFLPSLIVEVDRHEGDEDKAAWIDLSDGRRSVTIEYRPELGFGLYINDESEEDDFGSGPAELYRDVHALINRVRKLFGGSGNTTITRLREIREVLGVSQKQLSTIFNQEQSSISKMESRDKIFLSTLVSYIHNLGGTLEMKIHFKECDLPLAIDKFIDFDSDDDTEVSKGRVTSSHKDG
ncbi:hypothetical protein ACOCG7_34130 (plasmid) [Paraburkholderia sp. DD10]|uniref:hypothetical protein n=1 Tax=Paraburkholderia sp. DD10 TaxID=3409691 RepID=UPI003B9F5833